MLVPTLAMIVIIVCSFMLNFPGLRLQVYPKVVNWRVGRTFSNNLPAGKALSTIDRQSLFVRDQSGQDTQQLSSIGSNTDSRVSNGEELIDETTSSHEKGTNDPRTECTGGHTRVIVVVDHSTDLGVGRVLDASHQRLTRTAIISSRLTTIIRAASILSSWWTL
jgi:hypothetical protein